jgi:methyl-accepting chemotaxis protein
VTSNRRHRRLIERQERSERIFVDALGDIDRSIQSSTESIQRNTERLGDMGGALREIRDAVREMREEIRANTRAVLSVLDRLGPAPG